MEIATPQDSLAEQLAGILWPIGKPTLVETRLNAVIETGRETTIAEQELAGLNRPLCAIKAAVVGGNRAVTRELGMRATGGPVTGWAIAVSRAEEDPVTLVRLAAAVASAEAVPEPAVHVDRPAWVPGEAVAEADAADDI